MRVTEVLEPGIIELGRRIIPWLERLREVLRDALRPSDDIEVRVYDGSVLTGFLVLDHGRLVAMWVARSYVPRAPSAPGPPRPPSQYRSHFDEHDDLPAWLRR